jgi:hypothetical protein
MIEFFSFTVKGTVIRNHVFFFNYIGDPLYGPALCSKIRRIRETGVTSRSPFLEIS